MESKIRPRYVLLLCLSIFFTLQLQLGCPAENFYEQLPEGSIGQNGGLIQGYESTKGIYFQIPIGSLNSVYPFELQETKQTYPKELKPITLLVKITPANVKFQTSLPASLLLPIIWKNLSSNRSLFETHAYQYDGENWKRVPAVLDDGNGIINIPVSQTGIYAAFVDTSVAPYKPIKKEPTKEPTIEPVAESTSEVYLDAGTEPMPEKSKENRPEIWKENRPEGKPEQAHNESVPENKATENKAEVTIEKQPTQETKKEG